MRRICRCMLALIGRVGLLGAVLLGMLLERRMIGTRHRLARGAFWQERTRANNRLAGDDVSFCKSSPLL